MEEAFVDSCWYVFYSVGWVVASAVDVLDCSVGICVGRVAVLSQVECDIQEVDNLFVGVDGNAYVVIRHYIVHRGS